MKKREHRSRSRLGHYDDSSDDDVMLKYRRERHYHRPRSPRYPSPRREEYVRQPESAYTYKVLCISSLHPKASDEVVKDLIYREYKKYGEFSIRLSRDLDERVAYVCFRNPEDAYDAKHGKSRIIIYDKPALVEPIQDMNFSPGHAYPKQPRSMSPEYEAMHYPRSPERMRPMEHYESYGMPPYHEYRREPYYEYMPRGPPMDYFNHYYPQHRQMPRMQPDRMDSKKDKFPNYLHHTLPEDDPLATRTLFAGNLEINIMDEELKHIFGRFGIVEDIDIKRPPPGTGNAFAFVRFHTLDMAYRAKIELSGQYIGKFQCKVGYGKATPTSKIWVGGLGPWTSITQLEREFDRFGAIKKIEYFKGDIQAYIYYESLDAAQMAVKEMRGYPLGGPDKRLRLDFADFAVPNANNNNNNNRPNNGEENAEANKRAPVNEETPQFRKLPYPEFKVHNRNPYKLVNHHNRPPPPPPNEEKTEDYNTYDRFNRTRSAPRSVDTDSDSGSSKTVSFAYCKTLPEVARKSTTTWQGGLVLKNSLFPAKLHLIEGDNDIVDTLMKDEDGKTQLRITQRLRLDMPKLEDVEKRLSSANSHAIFLGLTTSNNNTITSTDSNIQTRPLRNLVSYLKQKEAAGVISLLNKETEVTGLLYSFPPCTFSSDLLKRTCPNLPEESLKEDHLVIVVVRGGTS